jgi:hypothetical protein
MRSFVVGGASTIESKIFMIVVTTSIGLIWSLLLLLTATSTPVQAFQGIINNNYNYNNVPQHTVHVVVTYQPFVPVVQTKRTSSIITKTTSTTTTSTSIGQRKYTLQPLLAIPTQHLFDLTAAADIGDTIKYDSLSSSISVLLASDYGNDFNVLELVTNIGIGIGLVVLITFGLVYLFATIIIPKAAVELEKQIKDLYPDLWDQYESKLQPGEKLADRPDLIQELGTELRRIQLAEFDQQQQQQSQSQQQQQQQEESTSTTSNTNTVQNYKGQEVYRNPLDSTSTTMNADNNNNNNNNKAKRNDAIIVDVEVEKES